MPASPLISTTWPRPSSLVLCQARRSSPVSSSRPTSAGGAAPLVSRSSASSAIVAQPGHAPGLDQPGDALQLVGAQILVDEGVAGDLLGQRADDDAVAAGEALQSGGHVRRLADHRALLRHALADHLADHHDAGRDADPDRDLDPLGRARASAFSPAIASTIASPLRTARSALRSSDFG